MSKEPALSLSKGTVLCAILAGLLAAPAAAQQGSLQVSAAAQATTGESARDLNLGAFEPDLGRGLVPARHPLRHCAAGAARHRAAERAALRPHLRIIARPEVSGASGGRWKPETPTTRRRSASTSSRISPPLQSRSAARRSVRARRAPTSDSWPAKRRSGATSSAAIPTPSIRRSSRGARRTTPVTGSM